MNTVPSNVSTGSVENHILIIDDDPVFRKVLRRQLEDHYEISEAGKLAEVEVALLKKPAALVLLDYHVPGIDSFKVLEECIQKKMPVIMISGHGGEELVISAMRKGAIDYLSKDSLTRAELLVTIKNALEKSSLRRIKEQQEQDLQQFVSVASHDLRAPLSNLSSCCELLRDSLQNQKLEGMQQNLLEIMRDSVGNMLQLLEKLLEYTREGRERTDFLFVDTGQLVQSVIDSLHYEITRKNARVEYDNLPHVYGDPASLRQLFQNLIDNALKFNNSEIPVVKIYCEAKTDYWQFSVEDNGIGIPEEKFEEVFKPLVKIHSNEVYEGVGIGLATCARVIGRHNGNISLSSTPGKGTKFVFTVPMELPDSVSVMPELEKQNTSSAVK